MMATRAAKGAAKTIHFREVAMKSLFLLAALAVFFLQAHASANFCISVTDVCCTGGSTTGTHTLNASDSFEWWYIHYDTGTAVDKVTIIARADGFELWRKENLCGCGNTSVNYPIANEHVITIEVECTYCSMPPCAASTASVQVYSPSTHNCKASCEID
jgi:hypothetical protein